MVTTIPTASVSPLRSPLLSEVSPAVRHGFFTRQGGVSSGIYEGLNVGLGSNDERADVEENRRRVAAWFGQPVERLATVHQVHSPDVQVVDGSYDGARPKADALVTATPGIVLGVLAADCGPVLFADAKAGVVGAAHAGWRGALTGVLESTVDAMVGLGARRETIRACLGPSISRANYEVGDEFVQRFADEDKDYLAFFHDAERPGHRMFDLPALTLFRLSKAGVQATSLELCTYADPERFFSYRRTTHAGEPDYGRQISAIALMEN